MPLTWYSQHACLTPDVQHIFLMECMLSWAGPMSTVRTPRFADIIGPMVDPQALSLRTTTSYTTTIIQITITDHEILKEYNKETWIYH